MKVIAYIDGLNLYHGINKIQDDKLKWLNLYSLCEGYCQSFNLGNLVAVKYFTAIPYWHGQEKEKRHEDYISALSHHGVICFKSHFKKKRLNAIICLKCSKKISNKIAKWINTDNPKWLWNVFKSMCKMNKKDIKKPTKYNYHNNCVVCNTELYTHEEKETDVKIGIEIIADAYENKMDTIMVISADTDFTPALEKIKNLHNKKIVILTPPHQKPMLKHLANTSSKINRRILNKHLLPQAITLSNGRIITRPVQYS